jgi:hypothetical protein
MIRGAMRIATHASGLVAALLLFGSYDARADAVDGHATVRLGVGGEPLLWYVPASETTHLGGRAFGRIQVDVTPLVALRADLGVGALDGVSSKFAIDKGATSVPISFRGDLQLNLASHYAVDVGADVGVDVYRNSSPKSGVIINPGGDHDVESTSPGKSGAAGMLGMHVSPATFRFGQLNQFQLAAQEGLMVFLVSGRNPAFEQTVSFVYLFGR